MDSEINRKAGFADNLSYEPMHDYRSVDIEEWSKLWWSHLAVLDHDSTSYMTAERFVAAQLGLHPAVREVDAQDLGFMMELLGIIGSANPFAAESESALEQHQHKEWDRFHQLGCMLGRQLVRNTLDDAVTYVALRIEGERAGTDYLTGAPNRRGLVRQLQDRYGITDEPVRRDAYGNQPAMNIAHLYFDANRFRWINKTLGHHIGDAALIEEYWEAAGMFRDSDILYRHGGDEFGVLLDNVTEEELGRITNRILVGQLEKAAGSSFFEAMNTIEARVSEIAASGGPLRIEARQKDLTQAELERGARPHHMIYINGFVVAELRDIVTLSVGASFGPVSSLADIESQRRIADAAMTNTKSMFAELLERMRDVDDSSAREPP